MRFVALATDYDGTIATDGLVDDATLRALRRFVDSGRTLILVTGRRLEDLQSVFPHLELFERVVVENGAVVFCPRTKELRVLEPPPAQAFVDRLRARGVTSLSVGHVIVATWQPHEETVLDTIRSMGLELHVEFNKGAVMVLPAGVTKRTGLSAAADDLGFSLHNIVAVGDAENDHAFLSACGCAAAVQNAVSSLKDHSDVITGASRGPGVAELIERILRDDLAGLARAFRKSRITVGTASGGAPLVLSAQSNVLLVGPSGSGKSTVATTLLEALLDHGYQIAVVDPEGDHQQLEALATVGTSEHAPSLDEVERLLARPQRSVVANLLAVAHEDRPRWFSGWLAMVQRLRATTGRPHWLLVDEAHHVMPARAVSPIPPADGAFGLVLISLDAESLPRSVVGEIDVVLTPEEGAVASLASCSHALGRPEPAIRGRAGSTVVWRVDAPSAEAVDLPAPRHRHLRHRRKYARGDLGEDKSFFFRGPSGALNLRAQNLTLFAQIAMGVDDATWLHHLRAGDYSRWFRDTIKDPRLADAAEAVENDERLSAAESRARIRRAIDERYTLAQ